MIDVFTILLVFLLKSYSAEGQIMTITDELTLPVSTASKIPTTSSVIVITPKIILIDGNPLVNVEDVLNSDKLEIGKLYTDLLVKRRVAERVSDINQSMSFKGEITIQGDENIPFEILKKVMYTCGQTGYNNILLAVTSTTE
jgi:biopolymer transport protein ExbD